MSMAQYNTLPQRFIGLDIHNHYFVAAGVNAQQEMALSPRRVANHDLETWLQKTLTVEDAVVLEMTTNTYEFYDTLLPDVHSVTVVHPPHVALITRAQVKTDRKAALGLAQLHAAGLLVGIWIPPQAVRDLRALVAQPRKMTGLQTQAKNRLHALVHRQHLTLPEHGDPFAPEQQDWWLGSHPQRPRAGAPPHRPRRRAGADSRRPGGCRRGSVAALAATDRRGGPRCRAPRSEEQ